MIYCFDIDGTICNTVDGQYRDSVPFSNVIKRINNLYDEGHTIIFMTARGATSGMDWTDFTHKQLGAWNIKYHRLITNSKPHADVFIDDKAVNIKDWIDSE